MRSAPLPRRARQRGTDRVDQDLMGVGDHQLRAGLAAGDQRSAHDNAAGTALLDQAAERCGMRLEKALVDQGFKDEVVIHGALLDIDVEVVRRIPADQGKGLVPQPKRWVVERTNGTLLLHRRLVREYDHRPDTSVSRVYWASTANMARRLTTSSPAWRDSLGLAA